MNAITLWNKSRNGIAAMNVDARQFPGMDEITWEPYGNDLRIKMYFGSNYSYMDVSTNVSRSEMESVLDILYKKGVELGWVNPVGTAIVGLFGIATLGLAMVAIGVFMSKYPIVPITAIIRYLQLRSEGVVSEEAAAQAALSSGAWKALEQIFLEFAKRSKS
jgi:hypothetical protein